jgi:hypothetical protein
MRWTVTTGFATSSIFWKPNYCSGGGGGDDVAGLHHFQPQKQGVNGLTRMPCEEMLFRYNDNEATRNIQKRKGRRIKDDDMVVDILI